MVQSMFPAFGSHRMASLAPLERVSSRFTRCELLFTHPVASRGASAPTARSPPWGCLAMSQSSSDLGQVPDARSIAAEFFEVPLFGLMLRISEDWLTARQRGGVATAFAKSRFKKNSKVTGIMTSFFYLPALGRGEQVSRWGKLPH